MKYVGNVQSQANSEVYATASGALPNGKPVVVNSNGTVSLVAASGGSPGFGTATAFETGYASNSSSCFDSNSNRIVISYLDNGNSNYGTAVVGQVSGTAITFGTPVVFESASTSNTAAVFDANLNKIVIGYADEGNVSSGTAIVGTINASNNSISFGSATVFLQGYADKISGVFDSNSNKVVFSYRVSYETGYSSVGTVSGTGISFGSAVGFNTGGGNIGSTYSVSSVFDSTNNKVVIAYRGPSNRGTGIVGTVNNTSISFGSYTAYTNNVANNNKMVFDPDTGKVFIVYQDAGNSGYATTVLGTLSGTSISFGTPAVFVSSVVSDFAPVYDTSVNKVFLAYKNTKGYYALGTVSGTSISFTSPTLFYDATTSNVISTFDSNSNSVVIAFTDGGNNNYGTAIAYQSSPANLTAENYVGITNGVVEFDEGPASVGSEVVFEAGAAPFIATAYDSNANRVVVAYRDNANSTYGTAVVGTISGTSVSFGTPVVYKAARTDPQAITFDSNSNKVVITYKDHSNSNYGTAVVGTVSGTTISFGSAAVFESANVDQVVVTFDSNSNKVVVAYRDLGNSNYATCAVGTVSGTNISFGTPVIYQSTGASELAIAFDSNSNKIFFAYADEISESTSPGRSRIGTVSGTTISIESNQYYFLGSNTGDVDFITAAFDSSSNKIVVAYRDRGNSYYGTAVVATVSGTSISYGTPVVFNSAGGTQEIDTAYYASAGKMAVIYKNQGSNNDGTLVLATISGTSISFDPTTTVFNAANSLYAQCVYDSTAEKLFIAYSDESNSSYGTGIVYNAAFNNTVRGSTASGSTAIIQAGGAVNTLQTGLTPGQQYFVQTDGTLGLAADDPSVIAGTAVSATDLIVKG